MLKTRFWLDVVNVTVFLIALEPHITGESLHEWVTMAAVTTLIIHFLLHWDWFIRITTTFFKNPLHISRLNHVIAIMVFIGFTVTFTSGLMISRSFLPAFSLQGDGTRGWESVHKLAADLTLLVIALHFALHWDWVRNTFVRILVEPFRKQKSKSNNKVTDHI